MGRDQLLWLHQQPEYVEALERYMDESNTLSELLAEMEWSPTTPHQRESVKMQSARVRQARIVVIELRTDLLSKQNGSEG